jgi:hypothetical protein
MTRRPEVELPPVSDKLPARGFRKVTVGKFDRRQGFRYRRFHDHKHGINWLTSTFSTEIGQWIAVSQPSLLELIPKQ